MLWKESDNLVQCEQSEVARLHSLVFPVDAAIRSMNYESDTLIHFQHNHIPRDGCANELEVETFALHVEPAVEQDVKRSYLRIDFVSTTDGK